MSWVVAAVDRTAGNKNVGAGLGASLDGFRRDSPVHLKPPSTSAARRVTGTADLRQHDVQERLAAEPGSTVMTSSMSISAADRRRTPPGGWLQAKASASPAT